MVVTRAAIGSLGFRGVLVSVLVPLALALLVPRLVVESDRFRLGTADPLARPWRASLAPEHRGRLAILAVLTAAAALVTGPANTLMFVYAENVLELSSTATAALVVAGGPTGLVGLLVGRAGADRIGRRATAGAALVLLAASVLVAYSGPAATFGPGFLAAVLFGSVFATPALALGNELFPTDVRASAGGWLVVSGVLGATAGLVVVGVAADASGAFGGAMAVVCVPAAAVAALVLRLPETRGLELEQSAPPTTSPTRPARPT